MALDMKLLRSRDHEEWSRAFDELQLERLAFSSAWYGLQKFGGAVSQQDAEDVASAALSELALRAISRCPDASLIVAFVRTLVHHKAADLCRTKMTLKRGGADNRQEQEYEQPGQSPMEIAVLAHTDNVDRLRDQVAERLQIEDFALEKVVEVLESALAMTSFDKALLREHIVGGLTQAEFAETVQCPLGRVGRRKGLLLKKIREFLEGVATGSRLPRRNLND